MVYFINYKLIKKAKELRISPLHTANIEQFIL